MKFAKPARMKNMPKDISYFQHMQLTEARGQKKVLLHEKLLGREIDEK